MATACYLPSDTTADVSPTPSGTDWDGHINTVSRKLLFARSNSALATLAYNPDVADHLLDRSSMCAQFVSQILPPQVVAAQQITFGSRCLEAAASNNLFPAWKLYAVDVPGTSVLGTIVPIFKSALAEMATSLTGYCETRAGSALTLDVPWRLVFEVGADGLPVNTATDTHNHSWVFGDPMATGQRDLPQQGDTTACLPLLLLSNDLKTVFDVDAQFVGG